MERAHDGSWIYATYVWNAEGTDAELAPELGIRRAVRTPRHDIPGTTDCRACHEGGATPVFGFSALQLSSDRDPLAPHAETPAPGAIGLKELLARGFLRGVGTPKSDSPRIEARTARERAVLGYLHSNCGMCHNAAGPLAPLGLELAQSLAPRDNGLPAALRSTIDRPSRFRPGQVDCVRVAPGAPEHSVLVERMSSRQPALQMPPLGTHAVDQDALALVRDWIQHDLATPKDGASAPKLTSGHR